MTFFWYAEYAKISFGAYRFFRDWSMIDLIFLAGTTLAVAKTTSGSWIKILGDLELVSRLLLAPNDNWSLLY